MAEERRQQRQPARWNEAKNQALFLPRTKMCPHICTTKSAHKASYCQPYIADAFYFINLFFVLNYVIQV